MISKRVLVAAGLILGVQSGLPAQAPVGGIRPPRANPTISPYLNLLNRSNSTAFNYYQLYKPQVEFRNAYQQLNRDVTRLDRRIDQQETAFERLQLGPTGHQTSFMSYGSYFPGARR